VTVPSVDDIPTPEERVERFRKWAYKVAYGFVNAEIERESARGDSARHDVDDLAQEAMIAIWDAGTKKRDAVATYYAHAGRRAMVDALRGRAATGSGGGQHYRPRTTSADAIAEAEPDVWDALAASDALAGIEMAYHEGEIMQALAALKPQYREYVVRRFWGGQRDVDIASEMGTTNKAVGNWWARAIAPTLRTRLAHLSDAV
jgi:RNA polymerase sigma factor (sigma-70 family)